MKFSVTQKLKSLKKAVCLLTVSVVLAGTLASALPVRAVQLTNASIQAKEAQISQAAAERDKLKSTLSDLNKVKAALEKNKDDLQAYITELDANLMEIQDKIETLGEEIEAKLEEIEVTEQELLQAQLVMDAQYEAMKKRVRFIYESGDGYLVDQVMTAGSFGEMLNKSHYVEALSAYDRRKLVEYTEQRQLVKMTKLALEEEEATLKAAREAQEEEKSNLEELIAEKAEQIAGLNAEISDQNETIEEYKRSVAQQNSEIAALEAAVKAERQALEEANRPKYDGGMFTWPCPSCRTITSEFGWRVHPIYGDKRLHSGIDIGAQYGADIVAAYAGTVVAATYSSSMGNYVMISHGDGLYTIYMHASALYVSNGQTVSAGQKIAAVGSTGNSTGPHLHFTVRLNGEYVSPWNYLG